ncbi:hypothetical protein CKO51_19195 [Rhodopirellula sp. SM50]|nr:RiPP maturation radical SAM C-methyltransferase [Rhodopirellula sp. SM50]PAY17823.1 hypothetical protein CKO51_19195 [Rhodopirellula sp. SM50]
MLNPRVALVSMPWHSTNMPSIQLGINQALLSAHDIETTSYSFYLEWSRFLAQRVYHREEMLAGIESVSDTFHGVGLGEWIFGVPPLFPSDPPFDAEYYRFLVQKRIPASVIDSAFAVRNWVPEFLNQCVSEILAQSPGVVGFTTMFSQNIASLVLALKLKMQDSDLKVVFGGANCQGEMGVELFRRFPFIDAVVRGESEGVFPELIKQWQSGNSTSELPGICLRESDIQRINPTAANASFTMADVPQPDYDEYFQRLSRHPLQPIIDPQIQLPVESSRGCWWGEKSHCTFCGLNGATMSFRSKPAEQFHDQLMDLSQRYRRLRFFSVDNILDMNYHRELLPRLAEAPIDFQLFFEVKANLRKSQLRLMRDAGIRTIQPGIESFSTPILKLIRKGTTALQNIRLLKYCAELGIDVVWNVIYGFPNEPIAEYESMAAAAPSLVHLQPPRMVRLVIDRYSPYHTDPSSQGLQITGPAEFYAYIYREPASELSDLAYHFEAVHSDGRDPEQYTHALKAAIENWSHRYATNPGRLTLQLGPGFVRIHDHRFERPSEIILEGIEAAVYQAIRHGGNAESVRRHLHERHDVRVSATQVRDVLERFKAQSLAFVDDDRFLALAVNVHDTGADESDAGSAEQPLVFSL